MRATAAELRRAYAAVRAQTMALVEGLSAEDCMLQSMAEASPVKWHLAHVTWFFETFVLECLGNFRPYKAEFRVLFNSYYLGVGAMHPRPERGLLSRPALEEVLRYRQAVDERIDALLAGGGAELLGLVELGLHHEQQHQELILTDLKHHFSRNPLLPAYRSPGRARAAARAAAPAGFVSFAGGPAEIGAREAGFAFDNERPRHRVWLEPYALGNRLVSNGEYLRFIDDGGYSRPELWLSDGWDSVRREAWQAPLYWRRENREWSVFSLHGEMPVEDAEPVCHVSYYEADAYARWAGARLPSEAEWEHAAAAQPPADGNFLDAGLLQPRAAPGEGHPLKQLFGDAWEWTASAYLPYPGFRPGGGAVGEYNGKFMVNQMVLRGGSCVTPAGHLRPSYRNFFPAGARWQFSGIRLAHD